MVARSGKNGESAKNGQSDLEPGGRTRGTSDNSRALKDSSTVGAPSDVMQ